MTPDQKRIADLEDRIADLEERVAYYESEIGIIRRSTRVSYLRERTGVPQGQLLIVLALYDARGKVLSRFQILERAGPMLERNEDRSPKIVDAQLCLANHRYFGPVFRSQRGLGYSMTSEGIAKIDALLQGLPS